MHKLYSKKFVILGLLTVLVVGCGENQRESKKSEKQNQNKESSSVALVVNDNAPKNQEKSATPKTPVKVYKKAHVVLTAKGNSAVVGAVTLTQLEDGVRIIADVGGLTPGKHGFHIHEHGDCGGANAESAGGHYNPTHKKHGGPGTEERHMGDLGNLVANESGFAHYDRVDDGLSLNGDHSIIGKSIVVHEKEDDLKTDPAGNSGKRIACGVVVVSE